MTNKQSNKKRTLITKESFTDKVALSIKPSEFDPLKMQNFEASAEELDAFEHIRYGFSLGGIGLLIPTDTLSEVVTLQTICKLPNTASWFSGLINLRGNLMPVFNLKELLHTKEGVTKTTSINRRMLTIGQGEKAIALIIDTLPQPITIERKETKVPALSENAKGFAKTAYSFQERTWIDLDLESYLLSLRHQITLT